MATVGGRFLEQCVCHQENSVPNLVSPLLVFPGMEIQFNLLRSMRRAPWSSIKQCGTKESKLKAARKLAVDWMVQNVAKELWQSFSLGDLVRLVSEDTFEKSET